jgi:hypothetical protein
VGLGARPCGRRELRGRRRSMKRTLIIAVITLVALFVVAVVLGLAV